MSMHGAEWREQDGDILPRDEAEVQELVETAFTDAATRLVVSDTDDFYDNFAFQQAMGDRYGPGYLETYAHVVQSLETSADHRDGRDIMLPGKGWVSKGQYVAGELYRLRNKGELTKAGFDDLSALLLDAPADPTPEVPYSTPVSTGEGKAIEDADESEDIHTRHEYSDHGKAAANDY